MDFWQRVEVEVDKQATTFRWIAENVVHKSESTVATWRAKDTQPRASEAVMIARALNTTVEYLVDGDDGSQYVRELVQSEGSAFQPPGRIADIVGTLMQMNETELGIARAMVAAVRGHCADVGNQGQPGVA